jgi:hypothetical protein
LRIGTPYAVRRAMIASMSSAAKFTKNSRVEGLIAGGGRKCRPGDLREMAGSVEGHRCSTPWLHIGAKDVAIPPRESLGSSLLTNTPPDAGDVTRLLSHVEPLPGEDYATKRAKGLSDIHRPVPMLC